MNSDSLVNFLQQSFHVTLGATTSLVESLQDPQKREENLAHLQLDLNQLTQKLAEKGEMTEQEARRFVDSLINQGGSRSAEEVEVTVSPPPPDLNTAPPAAEPNAQLELQELTAQIAAIRLELEKLREQDPAS
ncbi:hypothetical protein H6G20_20555 [Desertifilum sp. FACHB-1129]|uniref:Uncharacterized protein n=2 Tax=Desertifilum tharense IPPAS B-1220 TaxID=1781255 RepID=A0A1E5QJ26_9CYAN|nr:MULTISPECIES: hypothetical protein [Desertifilum]MCD8489594.1 hypothetical protein [Desertifilum sp.]MDA0209511.1 hypothetical protein [Cyanobacteria bacterium FC1]MBD2314065.1 hypothetical protein [Desertifilum sp. FACHB-1129]MBD2321031.1 hypothetical protein [Desertifilum sp. FACHB-866]MBD2331160.1 hypothetical protein [Desertifilum sp. FACHB-868]